MQHIVQLVKIANISKSWMVECLCERNLNERMWETRKQTWVRRVRIPVCTKLTKRSKKLNQNSVLHIFRQIKFIIFRISFFQFQSIFKQHFFRNANNLTEPKRTKSYSNNEIEQSKYYDWGLKMCKLKTYHFKCIFNRKRMRYFPLLHGLVLNERFAFFFVFIPPDCIL